MRSPSHTFSAVLAGCLIASSGILLGATSASAATCPDSGWVGGDNITATGILKAGANIRTGASTSCTSVGQGQPSHSVTLHCYKTVGSYNWDRVADLTTGRAGWVREDALSHWATTYC